MSEAKPLSEQIEDIHHGDDVKAGSVAYWGAISCLTTLIIILLLHAGYNWFAEEQLRIKSFGNQGTYDQRVIELEKQRQRLVEGPRWLDDQQGIVAVPLEQAIRMTLDEYRQDSE